MSIGRSTPRVEGALKVTGAAKYAADVYPRNVLHAMLVGSPVAAGRVTAIDTTKAALVPGVVRIVTQVDVPRLPPLRDPVAIKYIPLQTDKVEWEGQAVAVVLAETIEAAEEAAALVRVTIEATPAIVPGKGEITMPQLSMPMGVDSTKGDPVAGFASADVTVEHTYMQPTRNHNAMETSACVAQWDGNKLTLWDSTQANGNPRLAMAMAFAIDREAVRVISPHTGGGFGSKGSVYPHEILAAQMARLMNRPVRLQLTRSQMYEMTVHQAECRMTITLGATRDGKLTAMRHDAVNTTSMSDTQFEGTGLSTMSSYACPSIEVRQRIERVNLVKSGPMRAPVEGPGSWAVESAMDELAHALEMDPLDLRLRNFAEVEPFHNKPWSSNKLREAYAEAAEAFGWRNRKALPKEDGAFVIGRGMAMGTMFTARFPSAARVRVHDTGHVTIETSANDIGTGNQTAAVLVAAEALGIDPSLVQIQWGDTVRRQNIWHNSRRKLAECGPRPGVNVRRRACGVASADIRWSVA